MARRGSPRWWTGKVRQFAAHVRARVTEDERRSVAALLPPAQHALWAGMHVADQRHGLDVAGSLRAAGVDDPEVITAGLLHDAGKGRTGVWPRVAWSLGEALGPWVWSVARRLPGMAPALDRLRDHAAESARLAAAAGCSPRTVELIRWQDAPRDPEFGELLRLADEAN